ncbi:MAG: CCA tRNA nucleotidyltransferase [Lachnospiraceae bacterium]|nr:CCA tRNA nucleotidyltransferase [Lachnospiraceae bacterium]
MRIDLPDKVKFILDTLLNAGYDAYAVGGCVRDSILGREPDDWDITTSALPEQVKTLFRRTIDTGIQHGTVTIMLEKEGFEVTTYRIDGEYQDSRHPSEVIFTPNLVEDLKRRDFTINAMAYNEKTGIVDEFHGMNDLEQKVIRAVGNPEERFTEDALRIMRAIRFSAQLGYSIEENTRKAITKLAPTLRNISAERIQVELVKLITSDHPFWLKDAYTSGVTKVILPELDEMMETVQHNPHHQYTVGEHVLHSLEYVEKDKVLRLAMLLHDVGKPSRKTTDDNGVDHFYHHAAAGEEIAKKILRRLKFDNDTIYKVTKIVYFHDYKVELTPRGVRRAMAKIGEDIFPYLFPVKRADVLAQSMYQRQEKLDDLAKLQQLYEKECKAGSCVSLKTLAVTGRDLIDAGFQPGPELGGILQDLLKIVIDDPACNTRETLLRQAKHLLTLTT